MDEKLKCLLGGSWVALSGVVSTVTRTATLFQGLLTPLVTTRETPSFVCRKTRRCLELLERGAHEENRPELCKSCKDGGDSSAEDSGGGFGG